ncbi:maspardin-like [Rhopilema esculentum]|uniref:maspardin-like n=1 Tax=Rhopilema esculentum TaxID=499914 RepID=UPI0031DA7A55
MIPSEPSAIRESQEYQSFRCTVPQQKVVVESNEEEDKIWIVFDAGPKSVRCPLIFLPPASGTGDIFFKQILALSSLGYRVMALEYPVYWTHKEWAEGFRKLLDHFDLDKVHIFGASLGGFLAQKFAEFTFKSPRVQSIILCNSFVDTTVFQQTVSSNLYWLLPGFVLKKMIMDNFSSEEVDPDIADSTDFLVERLDSLGRNEIASRLTLNCMDAYVEPQKLRDVTVTILDVFDQCAISDQVKDEVYKFYPNAKRAHLKTGGNFPYLCRSAEVNLHIQIHLRQFNKTKYSAIDPSYLPETEEIVAPEPALAPSQFIASSLDSEGEIEATGY